MVVQSFHVLVEELKHVRALKVAGIQAGEVIVIFTEAQPELDSETSDDVGVQIRVNTTLSRLSMG